MCATQNQAIYSFCGNLHRCQHRKAKVTISFLKLQIQIKPKHKDSFTFFQSRHSENTDMLREASVFEEYFVVQNPRILYAGLQCDCLPLQRLICHYYVIIIMSKKLKYFSMDGWG